MKSIGKCLSEKYVLNGIIESHFSDAYAYIFDYMFNFILYNLSLLTLGFLFHHPIAVTIYIIITGSLRAKHVFHAIYYHILYFLYIF